MTIELPVLRLGLAGFSAQQQEALGAAVPEAAGHLHWEIVAFEEADAWWINGARTHLVADGTIRVRSAAPNSRALQLHLPDIDRPVAFGLPMAASALEPVYSFDPASPDSIASVLAEFERWLAPITAQFCLASHIVENQSALGSGVFDFGSGGRLLAVVDMHGEIALLPGVDPHEFENAEWHRRPPKARLPENFVRTTLSQLMWHYSVRTQRDLLPRHYRTGPLYFRRPPRLPARLMQDAHLLLMRELATGPSSFEALRVRTGMPAPQLAQALAALYFVGSITSSAKRAAPALARRDDTEGSLYSQLPSGMDSVLPDEPPAVPAMQDYTAPAPMGPR